MERPFIDSKVAIAGMPTSFGEKHIFHRLFHKRFPNLDKGTVLGMQLYALMVADRDIWIYHETQHPAHMFPNATYFR
ncbi:hypothetical protein AW736_22785 [Termitidicoccus mucosus]|uniref:Uncharacterized protein n=1 Tax=Termitidicoccus mucosus TaxID=1184151 RepID=A0A178IBW3_9BACT|nr:hypothetical protein AW736_22785 [Opitutaceae bacterium TSB47]